MSPLAQGRFKEHVAQLRLQRGMEMQFGLLDGDDPSAAVGSMNQHWQDPAYAKPNIVMPQAHP